MDEKRDYRPLFVLAAVSALAGIALKDSIGWMHGFMGVGLCIFASLKLFNLSKFADGFSMYDLLGMRVPAYRYIYPFIELALGLAYLSYITPAITYVVTIIIFSFGAIGVFIALRRGLNVNCACMGNVLNVPLSTVTLAEDIVMIAMAGWMLVMLP